MNPKNIKRSIEIARALQYKQNGRCFHCCVVWNKNRVVSIATNIYGKSHPKILNFDYKNDGHQNLGLHAELAAIIKLNQIDCSDFTFVNIRLGFKGEIRLSKPCKGCDSLLRQVGFKRVFYTTETCIEELV